MTEKLKVDWWCVAPEDTCPIKNENDEIIYYRQLSEALEEYNQISELKKKIKNLEVAVEVLTKYSQKLEKKNKDLEEKNDALSDILLDNGLV